jgi:hypothetical protein
MSLEGINADLERFSKLKLWYKLLPVEGTEFLAFPWKGEQLSNVYTIPEGYDDDRVHWHFIESEKIEEMPLSGKAKEFIMRNPIRFNCFLRGVEEGGHIRGECQINADELEIVKRKYQEEYGYSDLKRIWITEHTMQLAIAKVILTKIHCFLSEHKYLSPKVGRKTKKLLRKLSQGNICRDSSEL